MKIGTLIYFRNVISPLEIFKGKVVYIGFEGNSEQGRDYLIVDTIRGKDKYPTIVYQEQIISETEALFEYEKQTLITKLEGQIRDCNSQLRALR